MVKIKAITLWQPWATLVAIGEKQYETRSWPTDYRGLLAIHAAKRQARPGETSSWISGTLERHGYRHRRHLPLGTVLCLVRLVKVLPTEVVVAMAATDHRLRNDELAFGNFTPGRFAWRLEMVKALREPIPARGYQGLWDWTVPDEIIESLMEGIQ